MGSWRDVILVHPAADLFPMMPRDELITLGNDIKKNGLRNPVAIWIDQDGQRYLADGRNRLDAMAIVGIDVMDGADGYLHYETVEGDPYDYVISANIHRRHLTAEQRRDLITKVLKATPGTSNRQIAEQVESDDKTVGKRRRELEATAEIPQLTKTTGKDGKARKQPIKKKRSESATVAAAQAEKHDDYQTWIAKVDAPEAVKLLKDLDVMLQPRDDWAVVIKAFGPVKFSETVVKFSEMVNTMKVELDQYNQAKADRAEQAKADRAEAKAKAKAEATG